MGDLSISLVGLSSEQARSLFHENMGHVFNKNNCLKFKVPNDYASVAWEFVGALYDSSNGFKRNYTFEQKEKTIVFRLDPPIVVK